MPNFDVSRIAGNIGALNALNSMTNINKQLSVHQARLASGKRINTAEDDPAGLTIATKLQARSEGLKVALGNIGDAKNLLAVAESGMGRINDLLVQMRNKAEQGASDTLGADERDALVKQMQAYATQIDDIVKQTKWNTTKLIDGSVGTLHFQTGADHGDTTDVSGLVDMSASGAVLNLASSGGGVRAAAKSNGHANITAAGFENPTVAGNDYLSELNSGLYTVKVSYGADGTAATVQLFSAADTAQSSPLNVDADGALGGSTYEAIDKKVTIDLTGGNTTVHFGNGLTATIADFAGGDANTTVEATVSYTSGAGSSVTLQSTQVAGGLTKNSSASDFSLYMDDIQGALDKVSEQLSLIGALNGRLSFKEDQVSAAQINVEGAYNRIMNANMAEEQVNASKFQILQQTSAAMLAQANAAPQFLLSLFR